MEKQDYRFYIKTRTLLGVKASEIHEELTEAYGSQAVSYPTIRRWSKAVEEGKMEIEDQPRSGRPVTEITPDNIDLVQRVLEEDPHSTYDDIEAETELSRGTIQRIINEHLQMTKVTSQWVPHQLTLEQEATKGQTMSPKSFKV